MSWSQFWKGIFVLSLFAFLFLLFVYLSPCDSPGLFAVDLCGISRFLFTIAYGVFVLNTTVLGLIWFRPGKGYARMSTNSVVVFFSVVALFALIGTPLEMLTIGIVHTKYSTFQHKREVEEAKSNYTISDFTEEPVVNEISGKYSGIRISFIVMVKRSGQYTVSSSVHDSKRWYIFSAKSFRTNLVKKVPQKVILTLTPLVGLSKRETSGPYQISLIFRDREPTREETFSGQSPLEVAISSDKTVVTGRALIYNPQLITRSYHFSDFDLPPLPDYMKNL